MPTSIAQKSGLCQWLLCWSSARRPKVSDRKFLNTIPGPARKKPGREHFPNGQSIDDFVGRMSAVQILMWLSAGVQPD